MSPSLSRPLSGPWKSSDAGSLEARPESIIKPDLFWPGRERRRPLRAAAVFLIGCVLVAVLALSSLGSETLASSNHGSLTAAQSFASEHGSTAKRLLHSIAAAKMAGRDSMAREQRKMLRSLAASQEAAEDKWFVKQGQAAAQAAESRAHREHEAHNLDLSGPGSLDDKAGLEAGLVNGFIDHNKKVSVMCQCMSEQYLHKVDISPMAGRSALG